MNVRISAVRCLKCRSVLPVDDYLYGCPHCYEQEQNASVTLQYKGSANILTEQKGMKRYTQFLPYSDFPSLGEGNTPVAIIDRQAEALGLSKLYTKNEFQNPTGSHKDRMNPFFIARAIDLGKNVVCCASTGNEAASLALYSAAAGLQCVCVATHAITPIWKTAVLAAGAELVMVDSMDERRVYLSEKIEEYGWYCATNQLDVPVGSPCFGVQGYKTIAFELYEEFGKELPEYILIPVGRGDLLYGIYEGFADLAEQSMLKKIPRLVGIEPIPRLERVLAGEDHRNKFPGDTSLTPSIGGYTATYQSQYALENSNGFAISVEQHTVVDAVKEFAQNGIYIESSSAITLTCLKEAMRQEKIPKGASVLIIATSHGYKNNPILLD